MVRPIANLLHTAGLWLEPFLCPTAVALGAIALGLYLLLLPLGWRDAIGHLMMQSTKETMRERDTYFHALPRLVYYTLLQAFSPKAMRNATLNRELFSYGTLGELLPRPCLYLGAVELNRGCEMVFSNNVLAELSSVGTVALWEQRADFGETDSQRSGYPFQISYDFSAYSIAEAVAASSAYPPFFSPITIRREEDHALVGTFVDGGVLDNAALNTPLEMVRYLTDRPRYVGQGATAENFGQRVTHLIVANAGAAPQINIPSHQWSPWKALRRSVETMFNDQETNVGIKIKLINSLSNIKIYPIGTWAPLPSDYAIGGSAIADLTGRIRTHFDRFDRIETAISVYFGYYWTDFGLRHLVEDPPRCRNFPDIANEVTGAPWVGALSPQDIMRHLAWSHQRSAFCRIIGRWFGR